MIAIYTPLVMLRIFWWLGWVNFWFWRSWMHRKVFCTVLSPNGLCFEAGEGEELGRESSRHQACLKSFQAKFKFWTVVFHQGIPYTLVYYRYTFTIYYMLWHIMYSLLTFQTWGGWLWDKAVGVRMVSPCDRCLPPHLLPHYRWRSAGPWRWLWGGSSASREVSHSQKSPPSPCPKGCSVHPVVQITIIHLIYLHT